MMKLRRFSYKEGNFSIFSQHFEGLTAEIIQQRIRLEKFIKEWPLFASSLTPLSPAHLPSKEKTAPLPRRMIEASEIIGVGPMAAVAGAFAQTAAEKGAELGDIGTIVENGGDIYARGDVSFTIGVFAGNSSLSGKCAFSITPDLLPLGICSSSGTMGHSYSSGSCDLATVFAKSAPLADAAATSACNAVHNREDLEQTAEQIAGIPGIQGVFLILGEDAAMAGNLPPLIPCSDPSLDTKITKDVFSSQ